MWKATTCAAPTRGASIGTSAFGWRSGGLDFWTTCGRADRVSSRNEAPTNEEEKALRIKRHFHILNRIGGSLASDCIYSLR
jgi:hypothetical protein